MNTSRRTFLGSLLALVLFKKAKTTTPYCILPAGTWSFERFRSQVNTAMGVHPTQKGWDVMEGICQESQTHYTDGLKEPDSQFGRDVLATIKPLTVKPF